MGVRKMKAPLLNLRMNSLVKENISNYYRVVCIHKNDEVGVDFYRGIKTSEKLVYFCYRYYHEQSNQTQSNQL